MKITRACDYAMRALIYMAQQPRSTVFMRSDLSKLSNVPDSFLGKILQNLAKADILKSERGKNGGFKLEKENHEISMLQVVVAVDGEIKITDCLADSTYCDNASSCKVHQIWCNIQNDISTKLQNTTLADLVVKGTI